MKNKKILMPVLSILVIGVVIFFCIKTAAVKIDCKKLSEQEKWESISNASVGDSVYFGNYNGNTEWEVFAKEDGKILVISKYALERRPYNTDLTSVTWESCTLRQWLNGTYVTSAFSSDEQEVIMSTNVVNSDGGNNTTDKVFLLSIGEVNKYLTSDGARKATLSDGTWVWWWLRSPGYPCRIAAFVIDDGSVKETGTRVDNALGAVRPALWINLES